MRPTGERARRATWALLALGAVLAAGCNTTPKLVRAYPGDPRPASDLALLKPMDEWQGLDHYRVRIEKVDGVVVEEARYGAHEVQLLPGRHVIEVSLQVGSSYSTSNLTLAFDAEAGKTYRVVAADVGAESFWQTLALRSRWTAWIVDAATGAVVAGKKPAET